MIRLIVVFFIGLALQVGFAKPDLMLRDMKKLVSESLISTDEIVQTCNEHLRFLETSRPDLSLSAEFIGGGYYGLFPVMIDGSTSKGLENEINKVITKYTFPPPYTMHLGINIHITDEQGKAHHFYIKSRGTATSSYIIHTPFGRKAFDDPVCVSHVLSIADQIKAFQAELEAESEKESLERGGLGFY